MTGKDIAAREKIFSIGLLKTGTATLRTALRTLGIGVRNVDKRLRPDVKAGRLQGLLAFFEEHEEETFRGWPLPLVYRDIFEAYGERARFIMTVRRDPQAWVKSLKTHVLRRGPIDNMRNLGMFDRLYPHGQERHYAARYESYISGVHAFFRERGAQHRLLELCWEKGDGWDTLCAFVDRPVPDVPFPYENRSAELAGKGFNEIVNGVLIAGYARLRHE